ncbi:TPA: hypothetical protein ACK0EI_002693 [Staphylococcus aureus]|nr:Uncharacterised protein [Staphylococcus aureus]SUK64511.1 Uncharacterised protein [Staphylococcus aureus]
MNTKILTGMTESSLSRKINKFINDNQIEVIDIKFSSSVFYFGAMIIYK